MGLFQYARLPFGISTAPALWQKSNGSSTTGVVYFIDDILVTGYTRLEHEANLSRVLDRIRECGLCLKKLKCLFFQKELEFFGHLISKDGVKPTKSRIRSVQEAPSPRNKQELQSF